MPAFPTMLSSGARLDLAPLYRSCLFSSQEPQESHLRVAQEFSEHQLRWKRGRVDTVMYRAQAQELSVVMLRYGAEIEVRPRPFDDFALLHVTLKGMAEIESDGKRVALAPGRSALLAPRKDLRMHWQEGSEQLIVKVPGSMLRTCSPDDDPMRQLPSVALSSQAADHQWAALIQSLLLATHYEAGGTAISRSWVNHFEQGVAAYLLAQHAAGPEEEAVHTPEPPDRRQKAVDLEHQRLEAMDAYMLARLGAPISLVDLAKVTGVSIRSLHTLSLKHHQVSPMERLRLLRLDAARAYLQAQSQASVTDAALLHGFGHLGRFSAYYRERFGELPSQTRSMH